MYVEKRRISVEILDQMAAHDSVDGASISIPFSFRL